MKEKAEAMVRINHRIRKDQHTYTKKLSKHLSTRNVKVGEGSALRKMVDYYMSKFPL